MENRVYLDWNATTPLRREAREAMAVAWDLGGNPSSVHAEGRRARGLVEDARAAVAAAVGHVGVDRHAVPAGGEGGFAREIEQFTHLRGACEGVAIVGDGGAEIGGDAGRGHFWGATIAEDGVTVRTSA